MGLLPLQLCYDLLDQCGQKQSKYLPPIWKETGKCKSLTFVFNEIEDKNRSFVQSLKSDIVATGNDSIICVRADAAYTCCPW